MSCNKKWTRGYFPIVPVCGSSEVGIIPWEMIEPYRGYLENWLHMTLEQIAEVGGLDYYELYTLFFTGHMLPETPCAYGKESRVKPKHIESVQQLITQWYDKYTKEG